MLNTVTEHHQARGASAELVHVRLIEEAHRLARSQGARAAEDAQAKEEAFANMERPAN